MKIRLTIVFWGVAVFAGCAEEQKPRSVIEFLDNPIVLEAALVRCGQNRAETRYDAECVNARQAISIIEAKEERARKEAFDAESNKKREALRRTQQAAAEARRRAEEEQRKREEAEYLAQFGELPPADDDVAAADETATNAPVAVFPESEDHQPASDVTLQPEPAIDGGNAPSAAASSTGNLDDVRDELRRRADEPAN